MMCLGKVLILGASLFVSSGDPERDQKVTNISACFVAVECGVAPVETKCPTLSPKKSLTE